MLRLPLAAPLLDGVRASFRSRVSGEPSGVPAWVRSIAEVGEGPGWFEPEGVVWRVHGDLSTLVGGVTALLGQAAHPLALAGVEQHSDYRSDPWQRLAGTARWLVVTTFGSAELAAICSKLGRIPTVAQYHADMGVINQDGDKVYRYMNFDKIEEFSGVAKTVAV